MTGWSAVGWCAAGTALYLILAFPLACLIGRALRRHDHPED